MLMHHTMQASRQHGVKALYILILGTKLKVT